MDTDRSGTLSIDELREGLVKYGITMTKDDLVTISEYIKKEGTNKELSLNQWKDFVRAHEVPPAGGADFDDSVGEFVPTDDSSGPTTFEDEEAFDNPLKQGALVDLETFEEEKK